VQPDCGDVCGTTIRVVGGVLDALHVGHPGDAFVAAVSKRLPVEFHIGHATLYLEISSQRGLGWLHVFPASH
jgi:hypothetical protein